MKKIANIENGIVVNVIVIPDTEENSEAFVADVLRLPGLWKDCTLRGGMGWSYDSADSVFIAPRPFASWALDDNLNWQPPTPKPEGPAIWNEDTLSWEELS